MKKIEITAASFVEFKTYFVDACILFLEYGNKADVDCPFCPFWYKNMTIDNWECADLGCCLTVDKKFKDYCTEYIKICREEK